MKKLTFSAVALLVMALLVMPAMAQDQPKYGGTIVCALEQNIPHFDPHKTVSTIEGRTFTLICETLVASATNFEVRPWLAESWEHSPDGSIWTFYLRKGVKWHNGRELTAEDVKWNFERMLDPKIGSGLYSKFKVIDSMETPDPHTIKFILKEPSASFLAAFSGPIIAPMIAPESLNEDGSVTHPIGTGPFQFVEWKSNDYAMFKKFKDYWQEGLPYLDGVKIQIVPDEVVRLTALRAGDVDTADILPIDDVVRLMESKPKDLEFTVSNLSTTLFISFNVMKPPFNDVRVRQAVLYGIDREQINQGTFRGYGKPTNQATPQEGFWMLDVPLVKRDIEKAKALLKEAGYPDGLDVTLLTSTGRADFMSSAQIVQEQLKEIGMRIKLELTDWPAYISKAVATDFTITICSFGLEPDPDFVYRPFYTTDCTYYWLTGNGYSNPELDKMLAQALAEMDQQRRKDLYTQAFKTIVQESPYICLAMGPVTAGWRSDVKGWRPLNVSMSFVYAGEGLQQTWLDR